MAAIEIPVRRAVLLSKVEETLVANGERFELSTNQYPGIHHPAGYRYLKTYETDPFPVFQFQADAINLEKRVFMVYGENTVVLSYRLLDESGPDNEYSLELRPLLAFRDYHSMAHANSAIRGDCEEDAAGVIRLQPYAGMPDLYFGHDGCSCEPTGVWYYNFEYAREQERGFFEREDLFQPFVIRCRLKPGRVLNLIASTQRRVAGEAEPLYKAELKRRTGLTASENGRATAAYVLTKAADQFIVRRSDGHTVIAGYHWFTDWGRDTMISLPGLTLSTGRSQIAKEILRTFAASSSQGMIPNRFGDASGEPEWNTVDAALWMFEATRCYLEESGDWAFVKDEIYPVLKDMIAWHRRGTRYGIHMTSDGLLIAEAALTWMDARVDGRAVTPRDGKAVEIQALWFNALSILQSFAERSGDQEYASDLATLRTLTKKSFLDQFWNEEAGCLFDVVQDAKRDGSIRPNQIFAVSLHYALVDGLAAKQLLDVVRSALLTIRGLRTLAPVDPQYRGQYKGDSAARDGAYHQGTVWPWLAGPFWAAWLKVHLYSAESKSAAGKWLDEFTPHMEEAGIGQVSEVFSGDAPHQAGGCIAQAWSVAELLRLSRLLGK